MKSFVTYIFSLLSFYVICQQPYDALELDNQMSVQLNSGESKFYQITVPIAVIVNTTNLIIHVKRDEELDKNNGMFSSPSTYVSKVSNVFTSIDQYKPT